MIYLDNAATTFPKPECVYTAMDTMARTAAVNAGRGAYRAARDAGALIGEVRDMLTSLVDAREQASVVLGPSVTVVLNQVINGLHWTAGSVAYVSPYEHNAVLRPLELLRNKYGFRVIELPLAADLSIDLQKTAELFTLEPPTFVAMTAISNTTGYILPCREVFSLAKKYKAFTLMDGAQAVGLLKLHFAQLKADVLTFAGHKTLYGPFGIAGCYVKNGVDFDVTISGGTGSRSLSLEMPNRMPDKLECASKDIVAIAGLYASLKWLGTVRPLKSEQELTAYLISGLESIPGIHIYRAPSPDKQAGVVSFNLDGFTCGETAAILDDRCDTAVRAGHHCAALIHKYFDNERFKGTVRASVGYFTTKEDIDTLLNTLKSIDRDMLKNIDLDALRGLC